jgi:hypothetical protein
MQRYFVFYEQGMNFIRKKVSVLSKKINLSLQKLTKTAIMHKSKLIRLYRTLTKAEHRQFKKWLQSPLHNRHKDVKQLFNYLSSRTSLDAEQLQREKAFAYLYPDRAFNMARLRHVMSFASETLEDFLQYLEYKNDHKNSAIALLKGLRERNLTKDATRFAKQLKEEGEQQPLRDEHYYQWAYQLESELFRLAIAEEQPEQTNLQAVMDHAAVAFVLTLLRHACTVLTHQNLYKTSYSIPFIDAILAYVDEGHYADIIAIQLYAACYRAFIYPNEPKHYQQLKTYLWEADAALRHEAFKEIYSLAINYCIRQLNRGQEAYTQEAFELYMNGLEQGVLLEKGFLSPIAYKNIVSIGLHLRHFDIIADFLPKGNTLLQSAYRASYIPYNQAHYYFAINAYDKAIDLLNNLVYYDLFMEIGGKLLLAKIYMAQQHTDLLEAFLNSFAQFIRRKPNLSAAHKKGFANTVRIMQKLIYTYTKEQQERLLEEIHNTAQLPEKRWLLEQVQQVV